MSLDYIFQKDINDGILFINKALEKDEEEKMYRQWLVQLPMMDKKSFISFKEYKNTLRGKNIDSRSTDEILKEIEEIEKTFAKSSNTGKKEVQNGS